jgi:hypothetical protein
MSRDSPGHSVPDYVATPIFLLLFPFLYFIYYHKFAITNMEKQRKIVCKYAQMTCVH